MGSVCKSVLASVLLLTTAFFLQSCSAGPELPSLGVVPDFTLIDQSGATFHSKDKLDNHIWIADFIYTNCPGPCPRMSTQMNQIREAIGDDPAIKSVSFTID